MFLIRSTSSRPPVGEGLLQYAPTVIGMSDQHGLAEFLVNHQGELEWLENAMCSDMDISDFFVEAGHTIDPGVINICRMCPVREDCIKHSYRMSISGGYFGGISPGQRRDMDLQAALRYAKKDVVPPKRVVKPRKTQK